MDLTNSTPEFFVVLTKLDGHPVHLGSDGKIRPVIRGGADDGEPLALPDDLATLDEAAARELHATLESRFQERREAATTPAQVQELRDIRAMQGRLVERVSAIHAEAAEVARGLQEADAPVALPDAPTPDAPADAGTPADPIAAVPDATAAPAAQAAAQTAAVTPAGIAAARTPQTPAAQTPQSTPARPRAAYVAAAGQTEIQQGQAVDYEQLGAMAEQTKHRLNGRHENVRAYLASLPSFEEQASSLGIEILSPNNGISATDRMIREAVGDWRIRSGRATEQELARLGRTAAICDPLDIIREIPDCSTDADPFGDSLPQRPAGRLGFQFTPSIALSALDTGVTADWDDAAQALVDPTDSETWKPCVDIGCPTPSEVRAAAVTACVTFDVTTELSNPERVQDILAKLAALRVRKRTVRLLTLADAQSSKYTFTSEFGYGAFPGLIEASMSVLARMAYAERLNQGDWNVYLPPGLVEALVTDLVGRAFQDSEAMSQARMDVLAMVENITGLRAITLLDAIAGNPFAALNPIADAAVALPDLGCSDTVFPVRFIAPESALYFSTGEEKTGIEASPELMRQNKRQWFSEEFVGLAKHGCHPWVRVDMTLNPNGGRTGFTSPVAC